MIAVLRIAPCAAAAAAAAAAAHAKGRAARGDRGLAVHPQTCNSLNRIPALICVPNAPSALLPAASLAILYHFSMWELLENFAEDDGRKSVLWV